MVCGTCQKEFTRSPNQIKSKHGTTYCSPTCQYAGRGLGLTKRIVTVPYVRVAPPLPREHYLKVWEARRKNGTDRHTDETRARLSEATARALAEGRLEVVSKIEDIVADVLDGMGVGYRRQVGLRGALGRYVACLDFMLDDGRALEVNGTYWHCDPRVYPDGPINDTQQRCLIKWDSKMLVLAERGIPLLVVWEMDIRKDPAEAVAVALAAG